MEGLTVSSKDVEPRQGVDSKTTSICKMRRVLLSDTYFHIRNPGSPPRKRLFKFLDSSL